jgi:hypothetical protein
VAIRDFRDVPYIANEAAIQLAGTESAPPAPAATIAPLPGSNR